MKVSQPTMYYVFLVIATRKLVNFPWSFHLLLSALSTRRLRSISTYRSSATGQGVHVDFSLALLTLQIVHGREFPCASFVPAPPFQSGNSFICSVAGAVAGRTTVSGDAWVQASYQYSYSHIWRNLGFIIAFWIFFMALYLTVTELNSSSSSTAEVLVFRRGHVPKYIMQTGSAKSDEEAAEKETSSSTDDTAQEVSVIPPQKDFFTWRDVVYDIIIKGEPRRLLDHVSGWVKPGTLTA